MLQHIAIEIPSLTHTKDAGQQLSASPKSCPSSVNTVVFPGSLTANSKIQAGES